MALVSMRQLLDHAAENSYGLPAFTVNNLEQMRAIMEAVGIRDVLAKAIGTNNPHNVLRATMQGLMSLRSAEEVSALRGKKLEAPRK